MRGMPAALPNRIIELVRLRDGSAVVIRTVEPADRARILEVFSGFAHPTAVDAHDHEAIVAIDPETGATRGVASFVRCASEHDAAEAVVAVVDDWQKRGLGTAMVTRLTDRARRAGIRRYRVISGPENRRIRGILGRLGRTRSAGMEQGYVQYEVDLRAAA